MTAPETGEPKRIRAFSKRRCPDCGSPHWEWLGAIPATPEELDRHLLVRYRCRKCGNEFQSEEARGAKYTDSAEKCVHCGSSQIEKTSRAGADLELWFCQKCHGYMAIQDPDSRD